MPTKARKSIPGTLMLLPRPLTPQCFALTWALSTSYNRRCLHTAKGRPKENNRIYHQKPPKLSLFEELFPEETREEGKLDSSKGDSYNSVPRLPLPEVDEKLEESPGEPDGSRTRSDKVTNQAAAEAFRQQTLAVLALQVASNSLVENDFRCVVPKGIHITHWTGPGVYLRGM